MRNFKYTESRPKEAVHESEMQPGEKVTTDFYEKYGMYDQLTVNDYAPGQGIPPHVDTHSPFKEVFVSLSLKSGVSMNFRTPEGLQ